MKRIEALIRPHKLREVTDALIAVGIDDVTVANVYRCGRQPGPQSYYRGVKYTVEYVVSTRLHVFVPDALSSEVVAAILAAARTGVAGDGMILIDDYADPIPVGIDDAIDAGDTGESSPPDDDIDVPEESVLSRQRMGAVAIFTILMKLLGLASSRWHDF